jgi:hypothetical protein
LVNLGSESIPVPDWDGTNALVAEQNVTEDRAAVLGGSDEESETSSGPVREVNTYKDDSNLKDQQSTGRKRAAVMYPLDEEADCEWQQQINCGGNIPIVGCYNGKQQARHHGPDKNTLNNEGGNVHRICHNCHNRWHATNDPTYVWNSVYEQHAPKSATYQDIVDSEKKWKGVKLKKVKD